MITFYCSTCGQKLNFADKCAGTTGKCIYCQSRFTVPMPKSPVTSPQRSTNSSMPGPPSPNITLPAPSHEPANKRIKQKTEASPLFLVVTLCLVLLSTVAVLCLKVQASPLETLARSFGFCVGCYGFASIIIFPTSGGNSLSVVKMFFLGSLIILLALFGEIMS